MNDRKEPTERNRVQNGERERNGVLKTLFKSLVQTISEARISLEFLTT